MSKLFFFRHAQASFLKKNYDELSEHGEKQSELLGKYLVEKGIRFDKIFVGPLVRQQHTYEIVKSVFEKNNNTLPSFEILDGLKEHAGTEAMKIVFPTFVEKHPELQVLQKQAAENPKLVRRNTLLIFKQFMDEWAEDKIEVEGYEPWSVFRKNVKGALNTILEKTGKGETIGIFTSGGTISSITAEALNVQDEKKVAAMNFSVRNTSFTTFLYSNKDFNLLSFNELPHLNDKMITFV